MGCDIGFTDKTEAARRLDECRSQSVNSPTSMIDTFDSPSKGAKNRSDSVRPAFGLLGIIDEKENENRSRSMLFVQDIENEASASASASASDCRPIDRVADEIVTVHESGASVKPSSMETGV